MDILLKEELNHLHVYVKLPIHLLEMINVIVVYHHVKHVRLLVVKIVIHVLIIII